MAALAAALCFGATGATSIADVVPQPFTIAVPELNAEPNASGTPDSTWADAARVYADYDFTYHRAGERTIALVAQDRRALDLAFYVTQAEPLVATQHTDGPGVLADDYVGIILWPQGTHGFAYEFAVNPLGAHYQTSSENLSYSPQWVSNAVAMAHAYSVTIRIPFDILRTGDSHRWTAQIVRYVASRSSLQVWEHLPDQVSPEDPVFAGTLVGMLPTEARKSEPRFQVYGLAAMGSRGAGSTSRLGADFAVPVTPTSSVVGSLYPDYSNVEVDQQTIVPTEFPRQYAEVRPFFTQAASAFNSHMACINCPLTLYTPLIPAFRYGVAYEGTVNAFTFNAFDVRGYGRDDDAETLNFNESDKKSGYVVDIQRVGAHLVNADDVTTTVSTGYGNNRTHFYVYSNLGMDEGTYATDPSLRTYSEYGLGYAMQNTYAAFSLQHVGAQFQPLDGYVSQPDDTGYAFNASKTIVEGQHAFLRDIVLNANVSRFHNRFGRPNNAQTNGNVTFDLRNQLLIQLNAGSNSAIAANGQYLPFTVTNGVYIGYKAQTATPSGISYSAGAFYHGKTAVWDYATTVPIARRINLGFELNENTYSPFTDSEPIARQWLQRLTLDFQLSTGSSIDVGLRRIVGRNSPNAYVPAPPDPLQCLYTDQFTPFGCVDATNITAAFHFLASRNEFYVVYGDPNSLSTAHALFLKWIRYIGASKGT